MIIFNQTPTVLKKKTPNKATSLEFHKVDVVIFLSDLKNFVLKVLTTKVTKRNVLSVVSCIYDPLGFLQPLLVTMNIILQKIFLKQWEQTIPENLATNRLRVLYDYQFL